jgi:hypothetical protein
MRRRYRHEILQLSDGSNDARISLHLHPDERVTVKEVGISSKDAVNRAADMLFSVVLEISTEPRTVVSGGYADLATLKTVEIEWRLVNDEELLDEDENYGATVVLKRERPRLPNWQYGRGPMAHNAPEIDLLVRHLVWRLVG